jgi:hypothetical protein
MKHIVRNIIKIVKTKIILLKTQYFNIKKKILKKINIKNL